MRGLPAISAGLCPPPVCRSPVTSPLAAAVGTRGGTVVGSQLVTCGIADFRDMGSKAVAALRRQATGRRPASPPVERVACTAPDRHDDRGTRAVSRRAHGPECSDAG